MVCLYILYIPVIYVAKVLRGIRFETQLYNDFKKVASAGGYTVTGAFERFMTGCLENGVLVFPERGTAGFEAEARVLVDWLRKGKRFYYGEGGVELNIGGRLILLLPKVCDSELRRTMEEVLKGSVIEQEQSSMLPGPLMENAEVYQRRLGLIE